MDFGISTKCFGTTPLTVDLLERLRRAAFSVIELYGVLPGFNYHNRSMVRSLVRWFSDVQLPSPSLHLPTGRPEEDILSSRSIERQRALDEIKRCLELCDLMPLSFVVLHLGTEGQKPGLEIELGRGAAGSMGRTVGQVAQS
jgi:sugar phosphate isomerase/epimerase